MILDHADCTSVTFASPNIKKQANLRLPLNVQKLKMFQLQGGLCPLWSPDQGLGRLHIAPLILFHHLMNMYGAIACDKGGSRAFDSLSAAVHYCVPFLTFM